MRDSQEFSKENRKPSFYIDAYTEALCVRQLQEAMLCFIEPKSFDIIL
jgi:hypothetical protein